MNNNRSIKEEMMIRSIAEETKLQIINAFLQDQIDYAGGRLDNQHVLSTSMIVTIIMKTFLTEDFVQDCEYILQEGK